MSIYLAPLDFFEETIVTFENPSLVILTRFKNFILVGIILEERLLILLGLEPKIHVRK